MRQAMIKFSAISLAFLKLDKDDELLQFLDVQKTFCKEMSGGLGQFCLDHYVLKSTDLRHGILKFETYHMP